MQWRTHILFACNCLWPLALMPHLLPPEQLPSVILAASLGSLLPDLDASESKIKHISIAQVQPFMLPALAIHREFGHRKFFHSLGALAVMILLAAPLALWAGWWVPIGLSLGYASHLAADACTHSGIPLLYPLRRRYHLLPKRLLVVTGSMAEQALVPILAASLLVFLLTRLPDALQH